MSKQLKTYKVTNKTTGESFSMSSPTKPTQADIKRISEMRRKTKEQANTADAEWEDRGLAAKIGGWISASSEAIAPQPMEQSEVEKLPISSRVGRLGQELGSGLLEPSNVATMLPAFAGPLGLAASSIAGGLQMAPSIPHVAKEAIESPSLESISRAALTGLGIAGTGVGTKVGLGGYGSKPGLVRPPRVEPPKTARPKPYIQKQLTEGRDFRNDLLTKDPVIDAEFVDQTPYQPQPSISGGIAGEEFYGPASRVQPPRQIEPPRTKQLTGEPPIDAEFADSFEMGPSDQPAQTLLEGQQQKQIGPGTQDFSFHERFGEPERPIVSPPSDIEGKIKDSLVTGQDIDVPLIEGYYGGLSKNKTSALLNKRRKAQGKELEMIDEILKKRGALPDETETFDLENQSPEPQEKVATTPEITEVIEEPKVEAPVVEQPSLESALEQSVAAKTKQPTAEGVTYDDLNYLEGRGDVAAKNIKKLIKEGKIDRNDSAAIEKALFTREGTIPEVKNPDVDITTKINQTLDAAESSGQLNPSETLLKDYKKIISDMAVRLGVPEGQAKSLAKKIMDDRIDSKTKNKLKEKPDTNLEDVLTKSVEQVKTPKVVAPARETVSIKEKTDYRVVRSPQGGFDVKKIITKGDRELDAGTVETFPDLKKAETLRDQLNHVFKNESSSTSSLTDEFEQKRLEATDPNARKAKVDQKKADLDSSQIDEPTYNKYNESLESLIDQEHVESQVLRDIADMGKKAGLDRDTIVQDLIDSMPRVNNSTNKAHIAANRVFRKGESGFISMDSLFNRMKRKNPEESAFIDDVRNQLTFWEKYFTKPERVSGRMGEHGQRLERMIENAQYESDALKGKIELKVQEAFENLTPREIGQRIAVTKDGKEIVLNAGNMDKYVDWENGVFKPKKGIKQITRKKGSLSNVILDGAEPANPKIARAAELYREAMNMLGDEAEASGISLASGGKHIPFDKMIYEMWPRGYTEGFYKSLKSDPKSYYRLVKEVAKDKNITVTEAENLLSNPKTFAEVTGRNQLRTLSKQDAFAIDPDVIFEHMNTMSHRVGLAKALGPHDIKGSLVADEITKLSNEGWNHEFASDTISRLVGRESIRDSLAKGENTVYNAITGLNNARLMTSFVLNNLAGATTMISRVGHGNTLKGLKATLGNMEVSRRMAMLSGARKGGVIEGQSGRIGKILGIPMSEKFIRTWADQSGRAAVNQLVPYLNKVRRSSPEFIRGKKLLDSLVGKDSLELIERGAASTEEFQRAGWQLSKDTQGLINPATFPKTWQNVGNNFFGNLALQYKRMATQSMGSLMESIKTNPKRALTAMTVTAPIIGEVLGDTGSALFGALSGVMTGEGATKAAIREVERRGKSLSNASKPLLQDTFGLSEGQSDLVARYIENMNRGFALGIIGDVIYSSAYMGGGAAGDIISGGLGPAYEFAWDMAKEIMDGSKDMMYGLKGEEYNKNDKNEALEMLGVLAPQRVTQSIKRSNDAASGGSGSSLPTVRPPSLPSLPGF